MAFVFGIDLSGPIPTLIFREDGDQIYTTHVGVDDECALTYSVVVGLSMGAGCREFYFKLVEIDAENYEEREYWDGREVGEFIDEENRDLILDVIKRVARLIVKTERPDCFYTCTYGDNLPPPALEKHEALNQIFTELGYEVTLTSSDRGRCSWWAERSDD